MSKSIKIRISFCTISSDFRIDDYETLSRILIHDTRRNQLILDDLTELVDQKKSVLLLTERKVHTEVLNLYLKDRFETITLSGDDTKRSQKSKMKQITA